ncbi:MAG: dTDP-4-dehydrorhamnose 3,5-epimerase family protein [Verrucomicrobiaceae bacterium]
MIPDIQALPIEGARLLSVPVFSDHRGSFETFWENGGGLEFRPVNAHHSYNVKAGTLRAFHFQEEPHGQSKLVTCVSGRVWDVIVDLRRDSATYLKWHGTELVAGDGRSTYVPKGCGHGYVTLEDDSTMAYLIEGAYVPEAAAVIRWDDPGLGVEWPDLDLTISEKDRNAPFLKR